MMTQRQCVFLKGDVDWCRHSARTLLADFDKQRVIHLSDYVEPDAVYRTITQKHAQQHLGKECDAVVFDATNGFNADSFGAIVGTIKAGGVLLVLLPNTMPESLWLTRFSHIADLFSSQHESIHTIQQGDELPTLTAPKAKQQSNDVMPTVDQTAAINAILTVVHGHRRRPLVLSSDRGRGKSAALGMAAAELIKQGKQSIIVTAPSLATVATVFEHAGRLLPEASVSKNQIELDTAHIRFIAPDALLESDIKADLVLVDEAAAIPAAMLAQLLDKFSRIVFATTLHGYEGTGLGFAIRFKQTLDDTTPNWRKVNMTQPIRWADDDALEALSFKALLLDAEPVNDALILNCQRDQCRFELVDRNALVNDETHLSELFGLMVLAHYRTRPSDLMMMLDRDDISVFVMRFQGHIVASAWCVLEGELDSDLAEAIYAGQRRLKGHLLPQSLLAHVGIAGAGALLYQRIIRLAVHPAVQSRGIGHQFVQHILQYATKATIDIVGASFAASVELIQFWSKTNFQPMRLGFHHDDVSGSHAVMMLSALSDAGQNSVQQGHQRFSQHWPLLLQQQFHHIQPHLIVSLSQLLARPADVCSDSDTHELATFAFKQRGFEFCQIVLWQALSVWITQPKFLMLSEQEQALCVMLILQQRSVSEVAKALAYSGKAQLITALRQAIRILLS
ncbi:MAG: GNAT family N-acetyltransferase [Gammaproteobacteria bacterium]|nr:GNAT family N-acetyltransferase [Gammaproteobacteria bacterium]